MKNFIVNKLAGLLVRLLRHEEVIQCLSSLLQKILREESTRAVMAESLGHQEVSKQLWISANIRPEESEDFSYAAYPNNITQESFNLATVETAQYIHRKMTHLYGIPSPIDLLTECISRVSLQGLYLEFGVFSGTTINHIASKTTTKVHGFDSFQGIPEDWNSVPAGTFSTQGKLPLVSENVELHVGSFEDTLPAFQTDHPENVAFLHIDSDLYSSAHTVLFGLRDQIVQGTIIVFDEYFNYPGWQLHEFKAFGEFIEDTGYNYEYIAFCSKGFSVGVKIL